MCAYLYKRILFESLKCVAIYNALPFYFMSLLNPILTIARALPAGKYFQTYSIPFCTHEKFMKRHQVHQDISRNIVDLSPLRFLRIWQFVKKSKKLQVYIWVSNTWRQYLSFIKKKTSVQYKAVCLSLNTDFRIP